MGSPPRNLPLLRVRELEHCSWSMFLKRPKYIWLVLTSYWGLWMWLSVTVAWRTLGVTCNVQMCFSMQNRIHIWQTFQTWPWSCSLDWMLLQPCPRTASNWASERKRENRSRERILLVRLLFSELHKRARKNKNPKSFS